MSIVSERFIIEPRTSDRSFWQSVWRGFKLRCPNCGKGKLFRNYLKPVDSCAACGEEYHQHQADDAPPYFTILIVGHVVVPLMLAIEVEYWPPVWAQMIVWPILTLVLSLVLLPRVKGAVIGMQWAKRMHGFGDISED